MNTKSSNIMKPDSVGYWNDKKEKLLRRYQNLNAKDLHFVEGKEEEMIKILAFKLGKTKQELLSIIITL